MSVVTAVVRRYLPRWRSKRVAPHRARCAAPDTPAGVGKQIFLSHAWQPDDEGRDTHRRAVALARELRAIGFTVWIDEDEIVNHIDHAIARGIERSSAVVVLVTRRYAEKVDRGVSVPGSNDAVLREWNYTHLLEKLVVPVVFERGMRDPQTWPRGVFAMRLGLTLFVDGSGDVHTAARRIARVLIRNGVCPRTRRAPPRTSVVL